MKRAGWIVYITIIILLTLLGLGEVKSFYDKQAQTFKFNRHDD